MSHKSWPILGQGGGVGHIFTKDWMGFASDTYGQSCLMEGLHRSKMNKSPV